MCESPITICIRINPKDQERLEALKAKHEKNTSVVVRKLIRDAALALQTQENAPKENQE